MRLSTRPCRHPLAAVLIATFVGLLVGLPGHAGEPEPGNAFEAVLHHYEAVRGALANDTTEGVADHGRQILDLLTALDSDFSAEKAGVEASAADTARTLLPELLRAATELARAESLEAARDAFYDLSKPLVRWRKASSGERPVVAYCPMAERSWLQPEGELGNPYYGQSMLRCGEVVDG